MTRPGLKTGGFFPPSFKLYDADFGKNMFASCFFIAYMLYFKLRSFNFSLDSDFFDPQKAKSNDL